MPCVIRWHGLPTHMEIFQRVLKSSLWTSLTRDTTRRTNLMLKAKFGFVAKVYQTATIRMKRRHQREWQLAVGLRPAILGNGYRTATSRSLIERRISSRPSTGSILHWKRCGALIYLGKWLTSIARICVSVRNCCCKHLRLRIDR